MTRSSRDSETETRMPSATDPSDPSYSSRCHLADDYASSTSQLNLLSFVHLQLRSEWSAVLPGCLVVNSDSSKLNIVASLIHDIVLLLTMLVRLLHFRGDGGGTFGVGLLLWKQV